MSTDPLEQYSIYGSSSARRSRSAASSVDSQGQARRVGLRGPLKEELRDELQELKVQFALLQEQSKQKDARISEQSSNLEKLENEVSVQNEMMAEMLSRAKSKTGRPPSPVPYDSTQQSMFAEMPPPPDYVPPDGIPMDVDEVPEGRAALLRYRKSLQAKVESEQSRHDGPKAEQPSAGPAKPSAGPTGPEVSAPGPPVWIKDLASVLQTQALASNEATQKAFLDFVAQSEANTAKLFAESKAESKKSREAADARLVQRDRQKVEIVVPSIPLADLRSTKKGKMSKYLTYRLFIRDLKSACASGCGNTVVLTRLDLPEDHAKRVESVPLGAAAIEEAERYAFDRYRTEFLPKRGILKYGCDAERLSRKKAFSDPRNFTDVESHLFSEWKEKNPDLLDLLGEPKVLFDENNPYREGQESIGYLLFCMLKILYNGVDGTSSWAQAVHNRKFSEAALIHPLVFIQEAELFVSLTQFASALKATVGISDIYQHIADHIYRAKDQRWFLIPAKALDWCVRWSTKAALLAREDDGTLSDLSEFFGLMLKALLQEELDSSMPAAKIDDKKPKEEARLADEKPKEDKKDKKKKEKEPKPPALPPEPTPPPPKPPEAPKPPPADDPKPEPSRKADDKKDDKKYDKKERQAPSLPAKVPKGACAFYAAGCCQRQPCSFLHRVEDHIAGHCIKCNTKHEPSDPCPVYKPRKLPPRGEKPEGSRVARSLVSILRTVLVAGDESSKAKGVLAFESPVCQDVGVSTDFGVGVSDVGVVFSDVGVGISDFELSQLEVEPTKKSAQMHDIANFHKVFSEKPWQVLHKKRSWTNSRAFGKISEVSENVAEVSEKVAQVSEKVTEVSEKVAEVSEKSRFSKTAKTKNSGFLKISVFPFALLGLFALSFLIASLSAPDHAGEVAMMTSNVNSGGEVPASWGLVDTGSISVIHGERAVASEKDVLYDMRLNGVGNHISVSKRLSNGEVFCPGESMIILPYDPICSLSTSKSLDDAGQFTFVIDGRTVSTQKINRSHYMNESDTAFIRKRLGDAFEKCMIEVIAADAQDENNHEAVKLYRSLRQDADELDELSCRIFGKIHPDEFCIGVTDLSFREVACREPNFVTTVKLYKRELSTATVRRCWRKSTSPPQFILELYRERRRLRSEQDDENAGKIEATGVPSNHRVEFSYASRAFSRIPTSHYLSHYPFHPDCAACTLGRANRLPFVTGILDPSKTFDGGRIAVFFDFAGKRLPLAGNGCSWALTYSSSLGHIGIAPLRTKEPDAVLAAVKSVYSKMRLDPSKVKHHQDKEGSGSVKTWINDQGGLFEPGTSAHSNSHGKAEVTVRTCLDGLRAAMFAGGLPHRYWADVAEAWTVNMNKDREVAFGNHRGASFIPGECSFVRLPQDVYVPPLVSPKGTKVMFRNYGVGEHACVVEFYDSRIGKRRMTEVTSAEFEEGFKRFAADDQVRPIFGFRVEADEKEQLAQVFRGMLDGENAIYKVPQERETPAERGRNRQTDAQKLASKQKKVDRRKKSARKAAIRAEDAYVAFDFEDVDNAEDIHALVTSPFSEDWCLEASLITEEMYDHYINASFEVGGDVYVNFHDDDTQFGVDTTVGHVQSEASVRIARTVTKKECENDGSFARLDWKGAWCKESNKYFAKFNAVEDSPQEMFGLPAGSQCVRFFPLRTVKHYETPSKHEPSVRVAAGGDDVKTFDGKGKWAPSPSAKTKFDQVSSATVETQRCFFVAARILAMLLLQSDADGAYLQADYDELEQLLRRGGFLFGILPREMWPEGSAAHGMRMPVFPIRAACYGLQEAGFLYDRFAENAMLSSRWFPLEDVDRAVSLFDVQIPISDTEPKYDEIPSFDAAAMRYVDDFIRAHRASCSAPDLGLLLKESTVVEKFIGQEVSLSKEDASFILSQIDYVTKMVGDFEEIISRKQLAPLKTRRLPGRKWTPREGTDGIFKDVAMSMVQSIAYVARLTRPEVLYCIVRLSKQFVTWDVRDDEWLRDVYGYLKGAARYVQYYEINEVDLKMRSLEFLVFTDSDLGGDLDSRKSTSGIFAVLRGDHGTWAPLLSVSKTQTGVGWSTPDAEIVAAVSGYKRAVRLHMLLCTLLRYDIPFRLLTDNTTVETVVAAGYSDQLAYMKRTQAISLAGARQAFGHLLGRAPTNENISDGFTKVLENVADFERFRESIGVRLAPE